MIKTLVNPSDILMDFRQWQIMMARLMPPAETTYKIFTNGRGMNRCYCYLFITDLHIYRASGVAKGSTAFPEISGKFKSAINFFKLITILNILYNDITNKPRNCILKL